MCCVFVCVCVCVCERAYVGACALKRVEERGREPVIEARDGSHPLPDLSIPDVQHR